jgi:hypothetical protein
MELRFITGERDEYALMREQSHFCLSCLSESLFKSYIFWDIKAGSPLEVNRHFGEIFCLHLQGLKISHTTHQHGAGSKESSASRWNCGHVPRKRRLAYDRLHGVMPQKIELFITTDVRTTDLTELLLFIWHFICYIGLLYFYIGIYRPYEGSGYYRTRIQKVLGSYLGRKTSIFWQRYFRGFPRSHHVNAYTVSPI